MNSRTLLITADDSFSISNYSLFDVCSVCFSLVFQTSSVQPESMVCCQTSVPLPSALLSADASTVKQKKTTKDNHKHSGSTINSGRYPVGLFSASFLKGWDTYPQWMKEWLGFTCVLPLCLRGLTFWVLTRNLILVRHIWILHRHHRSCYLVLRNDN